MLSILNEIFGKGNTVLQEVLVKKPLLIDVRSATEFAAGSVKGSINIPLSEITKRLKSLDKTKETIVFCQSGNRSAQALQILNQHGFNSVYNGGGWRTLQDLIE